MYDNTTYGVFWKSKYRVNPDEWSSFMSWFSNYDDAVREARELRENPSCLAVKIVERVEMFEDVPGTLWERRNHDKV